MSRRPSKDQANAFLAALGQLVTALPARYRAAAAAGLAFLAALVGALYVDQTQTTPQLATAVGPAGLDANLLRWSDDRVETQPAAYDADGHARLPSWSSDTPLVGRLPMSPTMGWGFAGAAAVAQKREALRYCLAELDAGPSEVAGVVRAVLAEFERTFDLLAFVEDCARPMLVLGATAGADCGVGADAWGCAWLRGSHIRVTHNGEVYGRGTMSRAQLVDVYEHEIGHALDRGHTDCGHPHGTDMAPVGCGNGPGIAVADYEDQHLGLRLRSAIPPVVPPVPQARGVWQRWTCPTRRGDDCEWAIEELAALDRPADSDSWWVEVVILPSGEWRFSEFLSVPGVR